MISTAAGPRLPHVLHSEQTYEVENALGKELVKDKAAVEVPNPNAKKPQVEVAAADDGEKATALGTDKKSLIEQLRGGKLTPEEKITTKAALKKIEDAEAEADEK
ncbi:MAG TPA: hypothetical protein VGR34_06100 [Candidatus Dormibacteraeota bacterium]|nr:hypothetical protein [Candidatus Dormibacteraeota bacterium]